MQSGRSPTIALEPWTNSIGLITTIQKERCILIEAANSSYIIIPRLETQKLIYSLECL